MPFKNWQQQCFSNCHSPAKNLWTLIQFSSPRYIFLLGQTVFPFPSDLLNMQSGTHWATKQHWQRLCSHRDGFNSKTLASSDSSHQWSRSSLIGLRDSANTALTSPPSRARSEHEQESQHSSSASVLPPNCSPLCRANGMRASESPAHGTPQWVGFFLPPPLPSHFHYVL